MIESERLRLLPLDHRLLSIWNEKGREQLEIELNLDPNDWEVDTHYYSETDDALKNFWLPYTKQNLDNFFWYTNWEIVLSEKKISIGGIGFGGYPEIGKTIVGYIIDNKYHNNGYATEALHGLLDWAFKHPILKTVLADTPKDNLASQKVLTKNMFECIGEGLADHTQIIQVFHWAKSRPI